MVNLRRDVITGLVRVRILHAAVSAPVSGVERALELETAGHHVGPGTLYPLLHSMQKDGWVKSTDRTVKGKRRRYYRATKKGRFQLEQALMALQQFLAGVVDPGAGLPADTAATGVASRPKAAAASRRKLAADTDGQRDDGERNGRHDPKAQGQAERVGDQAG